MSDTRSACSHIICDEVLGHFTTRDATAAVIESLSLATRRATKEGHTSKLCRRLYNYDLDTAGATSVACASHRAKTALFSASSI